MDSKIDRVWIWFLNKVAWWYYARMNALLRRQKLRMLKQELERQEVWKN